MIDEAAGDFVLLVKPILHDRVGRGAGRAMEPVVRIDRSPDSYLQVTQKLFDSIAVVGVRSSAVR